MSLETELGVKLFSREKRGVRLTQAGICFLEHAYDMIEQYKKMKDSMARFATAYSEVINLASIPVMIQYHLTEIISEFRMLYPNISFNLIEAESESVMMSLRKAERDFAIVRTDYLEQEQYNIRPLVEDRLVALVSEKHPLAQRTSVSLGELRKERFILPTTQSDLYRICVNACAGAGFMPNIVYAISGKPEITQRFVRKGDAITIAMEKVMSFNLLDGCRILPISEQIISTTALVWPKTAKLRPVCKVFENYLALHIQI